MIGVRLTRQSVAMSDDAWAPHEWEFTVAPGTTLAELVQIAIDDHYLATISGGRATWVVEADRLPLAVVAQQWREPRWLTDPNRPLVVSGGDSGHDWADLHFRYLVS